MLIVNKNSTAMQTTVNNMHGERNNDTMQNKHNNAATSYTAHLLGTESQTIVIFTGTSTKSA